MKILFLSQYLNQINAQMTSEWEQCQQKLALEQDPIHKLEYQQQWRKVIATQLSNDASEIAIRCCPPGNIPDDIEFPLTIESLTFDYSSLTTLPQSVFHLPELTELKIFDSHLKILPEEIGNLSSLTSLSVRNSYLECLPESIGKLINLSYLNLQVNQLTVLPQSIANLQNLTELDLWNNLIDDISIIDLLPNLNRYCRQSLYFDTLTSYIDTPYIKYIEP
jgi:Leucine-rich repeat (LRR) protein